MTIRLTAPRSVLPLAVLGSLGAFTPDEEARVIAAIPTASNADFVTLNYQLGLERNPSPEELNWQVSNLTNRVISREQFIASIKGAPEYSFTAGTNQASPNTISIAPPQTFTTAPAVAPPPASIAPTTPAGFQILGTSPTAPGTPAPGTPITIATTVNNTGGNPAPASATSLNLNIPTWGYAVAAAIVAALIFKGAR